ncbi:MAG: amidohydrolase, partial [Vicinamibacterales bacterium]
MPVRILVLALAVAGASASGQILPRVPAPDFVLFNGKVITVDRSFSIHQAVAIIGDRIMVVGNDDQMKTVAGSATRMIDLKGRSVIPGLMDNHLHSAGGGPGV